jgi:signal transduction histidine kinase
MAGRHGSSGVHGEALASWPNAPGTHEPDHFVQFYDSDSYLTESVCDFISAGLRNGEETVVIATRAHLESLETALSKRGLDPIATRIEGRYLTLDAAGTLSKFIVDGDIDFELLDETIGSSTARSGDGKRPIRIYGEMAAMLWDEGNVPSAIRLEDHWNSLLDVQPVTLMCGYPMRSFSREADTEPFNEVCNRHSWVRPTESFALLEEPNDRLLAVARLQQRISTDETERTGMKLEQMKLEDALKRLKELDRLRNDFVAMVVHDIRTPNAVVGAFLDILRKDWDTLDSERIVDLLNRAIANSAHVARLVDDILTASRIESGDFSYDVRPLDIAEIIYRAVGTARAANDSMRFEVSVPDGLPRALGDEARQLQILTNLLSNAAKFSARTSCVTVSARREGHHLQIDVRDEGLGISKVDQARVFSRFSRIESRIEPKIKGTGLGLYITEALVEGQGGSIWVTSELGVGSTFSYTVPVVHRRSADREHRS